MAGRFSTRRAMPDDPPVEDAHPRSPRRRRRRPPRRSPGRSFPKRSPNPIDHADDAVGDPAPPSHVVPSSNPLLTDKLLDAKVRLHRRLIEEINLSALEKLPEEEIRKHVQQLVSQYILVERLALNTQELDDFVSEILDEMTGPRPARAAAQGPQHQRHPDQRPRMRLCRARRHARAARGALQGRGASAAHHQQDRLGGRPPGRRIASDVRRAPARRLARQRRGAADRRRRPAGVDPQILQEAVQPQQAGRDRRAAAADGRAARRRRQGAHHHHHLGRHRLRQDHDAQRALRLHLREGAPDHHRGRRRAAAAAAACRAHGDAAAQHRGQGRNPPARTRQERAAHAARPHHPRRVPRRGSLRHAAGHEHRPRRLDGDHPRQYAARRHLAPRADDRHGRPADDGRLDPRPDRRRHPAHRAALAPVRRQAPRDEHRRDHRHGRRHHPDAGNLQIRAHRHRGGRHRAGPFPRRPACGRAFSPISSPKGSRSRATISTPASRCKSRCNIMSFDFDPIYLV